MSLLPKVLRFKLFDALSLKTMRYVNAVPRHKATGLVAQVYEQIANDFFLNGSLTSRSSVPNLLAAIWVVGRESILVDDKLDRTTKEAMAATLSNVNDCPYCGDMLVSLVHAGDRSEEAMQILQSQETEIDDPVLRARLTWIRAVATPGAAFPDSIPFTAEELPEVIATIVAMGDVNRFSHVVMAGSPVKEPLGIATIKRWSLRMFGNELRDTHINPLKPGMSLSLLVESKLPDDMIWASPHTRIADTIARWAGTVEREARSVVSPDVQKRVSENLNQWQGEIMPISRAWVEQEVIGLNEVDRPIARLALLLAKASYQIDEGVIESVLGESKDQERFIRILAWCSFTASRNLATRIHRQIDRMQENQRVA